jgi:hypothetical protein
VMPPTPASQIDYLDYTGSGGAHGACYDDVNYSGNVSVAP